MKTTPENELAPGLHREQHPCSLSSMEPGRRAVTSDQLSEALETITDGETIEVHHPEGKGKPTNMGVVEYQRRDGSKVRVHAGCWGRVNKDTVAWSYTSMGIIPENVRPLATGESAADRSGEPS